MALNAQEFMVKMENRMMFSPEDQEILKSQAKWGQEIAEEMAKHFYDFLQKDEEMNAIITAKEGRLARLHQTFIDWFQEMFTGMDNWGQNYADRRWKIGLVHVRIGITPQHVVPAMATVIREVNKMIESSHQDVKLKDALAKICMIDLAFIEQAYIEVSAQAVLNETGWSEALFKRLISNAVA